MTSDEEKDNNAVMTVAHRDYEKGLNSHAFFRVSNHEIGEDLVQDTFLKTWKYLVKGGKIEVMKSFLYHILNHLIVDQYRKHKTASLDELVEKGFEPSTGGHGRLINFIDGKKAILLIGALAPKYQKALRMRYIQDLSLKEMSSITGQTQNTMAVQVHRGVEKLKLLYNHV